MVVKYTNVHVAEPMPAKRKPAAARTAVADGKLRLIAAGLRLGARGQNLTSLGLRELAREAGLNPNTFYRHFGSMEDLALAAVDEVARQLRAGLHEVRRKAVKHTDATRGSAEFFFEFAARNREAFRVAVREIHGGSPAIRRALRRVMDEVGAEIADDIRSLGLARTDDPEMLREIATIIVDLLFYRSLDYIERPAERRAIIDRAVRLATLLFLGSASLMER